MLHKKVIGLREVSASKETPIGRERRRVWSSEYEVFVSVNKFGFAYGIGAPEEEDHSRLCVRHKAYDTVSKLFPTFALMRACGMHAHS